MSVPVTTVATTSGAAEEHETGRTSGAMGSGGPDSAGSSGVELSSPPSGATSTVTYPADGYDLFIQAVKAAGLYDKLVFSHGGPFTLFMPTNQAFKDSGLDLDFSGPGHATDA